MLLKINERKRWSNPPPEDAAQRAAQDEEIFQTARLVKSVTFNSIQILFVNIRTSSCGQYMSTIFGDYVAGFLGTGRQGNPYRLQPFDVCIPLW